MEPWRGGEIAMLALNRGSCVPRRITAEEAEQLNTHGSFGSYVGAFHPTGDTHYFPECKASKRANKELAWSLPSTTCKACLRKRAESLTGWRWYAKLNAEDVEYIKSVLKDEVADYGERQASWPPYENPYGDED
jgi:hypothetical protein